MPKIMVKSRQKTFSTLVSKFLKAFQLHVIFERNYLILVDLLNLGVWGGFQLGVRQIVKLTYAVFSFLYIFSRVMFFELAFLIVAFYSSAAICQFILALGLSLSGVLVTFCGGRVLSKLFERAPLLLKGLASLVNFFIALTLSLLVIYFAVYGAENVFEVHRTTPYLFCLPLSALILLLIFNENFKDWLGRVMPFRISWFLFIISFWLFHWLFPFLTSYTTGKGVLECLMEGNLSLAALEWFYGIARLQLDILFSLLIPGLTLSFNLLSDPKVYNVVVYLIDLLAVPEDESYVCCGGNPFSLVKEVLKALPPIEKGEDVLVYRSQVSAEIKAMPIEKAFLAQAKQHNIVWKHQKTGKLYLNSKLKAHYEQFFILNESKEIVGIQNLKLVVPSFEMESLVNKLSKQQVELGKQSNFIDFCMSQGCLKKASSLPVFEKIAYRLNFPHSEFIGENLYRSCSAYMVCKDSVLNAESCPLIVQDKGLGRLTPNGMLTTVGTINSNCVPVGL